MEPKITRSKDGRVWLHKGRKPSLFWSPSMIKKLRDLFPITKNDDLAIELGVSKRTMIRKARQLGLEKDPEWVESVKLKNLKIADAMLKLNPAKHKKFSSENMKKFQFKKGHPKVELTEEQERLKRLRQSATLRENNRRRRKGLPPLRTEKEKLANYKMYGL